MNANVKPEILLCIKCALFIHVNEKCGRSSSLPDYVHGKPAQAMPAQHERIWDTAFTCGPSGKFFVPIVLATPDHYAETMIRRDQENSHRGCSEQDLDIACRHLKAGS